MPQSTASEALARVQVARSFLFVPGDRTDRFDKAAASGADLVIIDLEDAVAAEHRQAARESVAAWLLAGGRASVRINATGTADHDQDVAALAGPDGDSLAGLCAIVVAKAEQPEELGELARVLDVPVVALVESAAGMARADEIAATDGVARLAFGHLDYAVDLGADHGRTAMLHARSALVLASRAAGLPGPVDGVTTALDDEDLLTGDLAHARELGMTGKLLVHPRQVEATHAAYRPSEEQVAWAGRVLAAARDTAGGAVRVEGEMIDAPVIARAHEVLRRRTAE